MFGEEDEGTIRGNILYEPLSKQVQVRVRRAKMRVSDIMLEEEQA